ncbi:MAG: AarF/ABC1/UbiB kinase family protein [Candidatus Woesearchaeota archaeon]
MIRKINRLKRVREILTVFFEEGFDYLIYKIALAKHVPFHKRLKKLLSKKELASEPVRLRNAFERLGPTFVKFGQMLSLRPDLIPKEYCIEFEKMQDNVPVFSFSEVKRILKKEYGKNPEEIFSEIEKKPIAAASLSQVHKAKLKNGKIVAIKVQRLNIKEIIEEDISILFWIAHLLEKRVSYLKERNVVEIVKEFKSYTEKELNFRLEAINQTIIKEQFKNDERIFIPEVNINLTTEKILVSEFVEGTSLHELKEERLLWAVNAAYEANLEMVFVNGFFHADPHPGNILLIKDKQQIAFVDFGIVGKFDERLRKKAANIFVGVLENDIDIVAKELISLGVVNEEKINIEEFKKELRDVLEPLQYYALKDIKVSVVLDDLFHIAVKHNIKVPVDFILLGKTILTLEGLGVRYNPDFNLFTNTKPILAKLMKRKFSVGEVKKKVERKISEYAEIAEDFPRYTLETLKRLSQGRIDINIEDRDMKKFHIELEHVSGNLTIGLLVAALIVGSSLIVLAKLEPSINGFPIVAIFGFSAAAILGIWIIKRTLFR